MTPIRPFTPSPGRLAWFIAQQKMISIKKHFAGTDRRYLYLRLDGRRAPLRVWPAAGPVHAREDVGAGADRRALHLLAPSGRPRTRRPLPRHRRRRKAGDSAKEQELLAAVDNFQTHVVPIIADIDAGFGNAEATYLLAKKMIEAGACALQIENQVSDESSAAIRTAR